MGRGGPDKVAEGGRAVCSCGEAERGERRRRWYTLRGKPQLYPLQGEAGMYIHRCIYFSSCYYFIRMKFIFVMQVAELQEGEVLHDARVYEKMRMKKPNLSLPQPQQFPEYF